jgi:hypothetical protein
MQSQNHIEGDNNVTIQGATGSTITIQVGGQMKEVANTLEALLEVIQNMQAQLLNINGRLLPVASLNPATFQYLMGQPGQGQQLPAELAEQALGEGNAWVQSLRRELIRQGVSIGNNPWDVFQHYGWLVETFLQKMGTAAGKEPSLRRLSFMAEAWQASLRYLCYIQTAQLLQVEGKAVPPLVLDFIQMDGNQFVDFDYTGLLLTATNVLGENGFMPEIHSFVEELTDTRSALYGTSLFLDYLRRRLLADTVVVDGTFNGLLEEYLRALVYWLRKLAFLAKYRLVSIKEINLNYRLGTARNFVHLYGELHGIYSEADSIKKEYLAKSVVDYFTYNKSVLLFKGHDVATCMDHINNPHSYLSLSPLMIDQSVYVGKPTQTPEIFYYTGYEKTKRKYHFAQYKNELPFGDSQTLISNKSLTVINENSQRPILNDLFEQLEYVFKPLTNKPA